MNEITIDGVKYTEYKIYNQYANWEEVCEQLKKEDQEEN